MQIRQKAAHKDATGSPGNPAVESDSFRICIARNVRQTNTARSAAERRGAGLTLVMDYKFAGRAGQKPARLPATSPMVISDSQGYLANFTGGLIDICFTGPGQFKARQTHAQLPHIWLTDIGEVQPRIARLFFAAKRTVALFATDADPKQFCDGVKLGPWDVMLLHGCVRPVHHRTQGPSNWGLIAVNQAAFITHCQALNGSDAGLPRQRQILRPTWSAAARLRQLHAKICDLASRTPSIMSHSEAARALENEVLHALVNCLAGGGDHIASPRRHIEIIDAFERVLTLRLSEPLTVAGMCAEIGVPERTLRACCLEILGMSPSRYLRLRRLNMVRAALECAKPTPGTIGTYAKRYGFSELGRFATFYRRTFGEAPSATLRRSRQAMVRSPV
jgi:AraC-like DNA-binding protein